MKLITTPLNSTTGELLPVYRDAYLRGDLARASAQAVDDYLHREAAAASPALVHWPPLPAAVTLNPVNQLPPAKREQPRFRRALSLSLLGLTLAGASTAASHLPSSKAPATELATVRTVLLHGRILNEQGQPLAGATVRQKGTTHSTRTDARGSYWLRVPAATSAKLQCSHNGYAQQETSALTSGLL